MDTDAPEQRLRLAALVVPASQPKMVAGAGRFDADEIVFDLAGAVADAKDTARAHLVDALTDTDYGQAIVSLRINPIDTMWAYRDLIDVIERAGEFVDCIVVPDVLAPGDIEFVDNLLRMMEARIDLAHTIGIMAQIDNPTGLTLINEIALVSERLEALVLDASAVGAHLGTTAPGPRPDGDPWRALRMQVLVAARAADVQAIEAHSIDPGDDAFESAVERSRGLGYDGVTCAHPAQVAAAKRIFDAG